MSIRLIAWDTSTKCGSIVAMEGDLDESHHSSLLSTSHSALHSISHSASHQSKLRMITELTLDVDLNHSECLLWGIHQALTAARWSLQDLNVLGVGVGPGSFTGLRIGLTTARTLAHALNKPLVGVSSLAALARPVALCFSQKGWNYPTCIVAATDACKGEFFALWGVAQAVAQCSTDLHSAEEVRSMPCLWHKGVVEQLFSPLTLVSQLKKWLLRGHRTRWVAIGEARQRYEAAWNELPKRQELVCPFIFPNQIQGRYLALLVWEAFLGGAGRAALQVHPRYLRASNAEIQMNARLFNRPQSELM